MWCVSWRRAEAIIAIGLAGLGAYWVVGAWVMPAGEFSVPGPGFIPTLVGSLLFLVAIGLLAARSRGATERVRLGHPHIWAALGAVVAVALLFERLGFFLTSALFLAVLLRLLSKLRWPALIAAAFAGAGVAHLFFAQLLGIQLPGMPWR